MVTVIGCHSYAVTYLMARLLQNVPNFSASIGKPLDKTTKMVCKSSRSHFSKPSISESVSRFLLLKANRAVLPSLVVPAFGFTTSTHSPSCCLIVSCIYFFLFSTISACKDFLRTLHTKWVIFIS